MSRFIAAKPGYKTTSPKLFLRQPQVCVLLTLRPHFSAPTPHFPTTIFILFHPLHALSNCIFFTHNLKIEFVTEFGNPSIIPIKIKRL